MLVDDGLLRRATTTAGSLAATSPSCPSPRRSTRCSPPASRASRPTSARCSPRVRSRARCSTASAVRELAPDALEPRRGPLPHGARPPGPDPPGPPDFAGEEAFRFRHVLIRDAAYRSLPKKRAGRPARALRRLARASGRDRLREFEEIVGYHLEQAFRYRAALGPLDARAAALAGRASERLEAAGRRALARSDLPAAIEPARARGRLLPTDDPRRSRCSPTRRRADRRRPAGRGRARARRGGAARLPPRTTSAPRRTCSSSSSSSGSSTARRAGSRTAARASSG